MAIKEKTRIDSVKSASQGMFTNKGPRTTEVSTPSKPGASVPKTIPKTLATMSSLPFKRFGTSGETTNTTPQKSSESDRKRKTIKDTMFPKGISPDRPEGLDPSIKPLELEMDERTGQVKSPTWQQQRDYDNQYERVDKLKGMPKYNPDPELVKRNILKNKLNQVKPKKGQLESIWPGLDLPGLPPIDKNKTGPRALV